MGRSVRVRGVPFVVIGVLVRKGQSPMGQDYDDTALVPASTFATKLQASLGNYINGAIFVSAIAADQTHRAQEEIAHLLRDRHRLPPGVDDDFSVRNLAELAAAQEQGTAILTTLLAAIGIALGLLAANRLAAHFHWPFSIHPEILAIAVGFSALVGVVFGLYPARKAANLDPIEALRFE